MLMEKVKSVCVCGFSLCVVCQWNFSIHFGRGQLEHFLLHSRKSGNRGVIESAPLFWCHSRGCGEKKSLASIHHVAFCFRVVMYRDSEVHEKWEWLFQKNNWLKSDFVLQSDPSTGKAPTQITILVVTQSDLMRFSFWSTKKYFANKKNRKAYFSIW